MHGDGTQPEVLTWCMCVPIMNMGAFGACTEMELSQKC